jgi:uncharacterized protein with HEPN domain
MYDKNVLYILTMLEAVEKIIIYTKKYENADEFYNDEDQKSFNAAVNLLIVIGEESKKIDNNIKSKHKNINWKLLAGLRDKISHDYRGIDPEIIWSIIIEDIDIIKSELVLIFIDLNLDKDFLSEIITSKYYTHIKYLVDIK